MVSRFFLAAAALATFAMGSASALTVEQTTSSANVNVTVENGIATIFGHVDNNFDSVLAAQEVMNLDGVASVRNLLTFSN